MTDKNIHKTIDPLVNAFMKELMIKYKKPLYHYLIKNPNLIKSFPGLLLNHEKAVVYVGRTHIAVEYVGPEVINELNSENITQILVHDYSTKDFNLLEKVIGFQFDSTLDFEIPLQQFSDNLIIPTNRGCKKLIDLRWNFGAQSMIFSMNSPCPVLVEGNFTRIVNGLFFDCDESGLKTRRIKWVDFFPVHFDGSESEFDSISFNLDQMGQLVEHDANYVYPLPEDYKFSQLPKVNRFIEKWGNTDSSEPEITSFLAQPENEFILTMNFGAMNAHSELTCEWQGQDKPNIRPDFFIVQPNGYADIVEFKLPDISKKTVVGSKNREAFSSWLNSYISQTRVYSSYFDDSANRAWFEKKYGFKVHKPRRYLVVGRRHDFDCDVWREIMHDYRNLEIMTFDDLVDGTVVQFYK